MTMDILPALILLLPCLLLWQIGFNKNTSPVRNILMVLLAIYIIGVFHVTGIPDVKSFSPQFNINLIPSIPLQRYSVQYVLNIFMFIPFGLLLSCLWKCFSKFHFTLLAGFCFSLGIEILQLLTFRVTDIDDLITNTLGSVIGYLLAKLCMHQWFSVQKSKHSQEPTASHGSDIKELLILFGLCFLIWSFILPFVNEFLWPVTG
ncbi:MAG: VanZ family protein, partial [Lachnospiraceae bacterium]|nr:VanZ family protein [Lachnospiraceae bacterium]